MKMNNFEEFGLKGDFEGKITCKIDNGYIGHVKQNGKTYPAIWDLSGFEKHILNDKFNLNPIKKEALEETK